MTSIDHERERERLAAIYAEKSELELAALAADQRALTEDALSALEAEFVKRGMPFERQELTIADEADVKLIPIRRFRDLPQALVAKGVLDSAGVKCFLSDENTVRMIGCGRTRWAGCVCGCAKMTYPMRRLCSRPNIPMRRI
jgi:hypothetical protein